MALGKIFLTGHGGLSRAKTKFLKMAMVSPERPNGRPSSHTQIPDQRVWNFLLQKISVLQLRRPCGGDSWKASYLFLNA